MCTDICLPSPLHTMSTPKDHQSAVVPCPFLLTTSGAMYSTVPQNEYVFESKASLLRPKSAGKGERERDAVPPWNTHMGEGGWSTSVMLLTWGDIVCPGEYSHRGHCTSTEILTQGEGTSYLCENTRPVLQLGSVLW